MQLAEQGHSVIAQIAAFTPQHIDLFDFRALIVVSPKSSVSPESLVKASERGKLIFVVAGVGDGMSSWANGVGVPAFAYPLSDVDINRLYEELRRRRATLQPMISMDELYLAVTCRHAFNLGWR